MKAKQCIDCGKWHRNISLVCTACILLRQQARQKGHIYTVPIKYSKFKFASNYGMSNSKLVNTFADQYEGVWEMPKATLSYEALQLDSEGQVLEGAYRLKLEGNFKQHIEPIVKFIKMSIPSSERTYDPTTYEWFYHEKWHPIMQTALGGSHFSIVYNVTKEAFTELKRKQAEWAKQAGQAFQTKQYNTDEDVLKFSNLLVTANAVLPEENQFTLVDKVAKFTRELAIAAYKKAIKFYHPDLHPERAEQASELNEVWSRLKEGYYIK